VESRQTLGGLGGDSGPGRIIWAVEHGEPTRRPGHRVGDGKEIWDRHVLKGRRPLMSPTRGCGGTGRKHGSLLFLSWGR
jgi:hypothetical protein